MTSEIIMKNGILYYKENSNESWNEADRRNFFLCDCDKLFQIAMDSLINNNEVLFHNTGCRNNCFGIRLNEGTGISSETLKELFSLVSDQKNQYSSYAPYYKTENAYMITAFFKWPSCDSSLKDEWKKYWELLKASVEKSKAWYLQLSKCEGDSIQARLILAASDLYDLKVASKSFRAVDENYREYFYQKNEYQEVSNQLSNLQKVSFEDDEAHRVIFEKSIIGENKIENN